MRSNFPGFRIKESRRILFILNTVVFISVSLLFAIQIGKRELHLKEFPHQIIKGNIHFYSDRSLTAKDSNLVESISQHLDYYWLLNGKNKVFNVFLCSKPDNYSFYSNLGGLNDKSQGINFGYLNRAYINEFYVNRIAGLNKRRSKYSILEGSLFHVIMHELAHQLMFDKIGFEKYKELPNWKKEGFAEFLASRSRKISDKDYSMSKQCEKINEGLFAEESKGRQFYILSEIATEYLFEFKKFTFSKFINDEIQLIEVLKEMNLNNSSIEIVTQFRG